MTDGRIDETTGVPKHLQIREMLKKEILNGTYPHGERIPSENQLSERWSVTRETVRKAIGELVGEHLLRRDHGRGTFVELRPVTFSFWNFGSFSNYVRSQNKVPVSRVVENRIVDHEGRPYFRLVRARGVEIGSRIVFITVDQSLLPLKIFPGIDERDYASESLYGVLNRDYGVTPTRAELSLSAIGAGEEEIRFFGVSTGQPLIRATGPVLDGEDKVVEISSVTYGPNADFSMATRFS